MKRIIITYGTISSVIIALMMFVMMAAFETVGMEGSMIVGYASMVLSFCLIFFGLKSYKKNNDGRITFLDGIKIGLAITAIACTVYTIIWMILSVTVYKNFMADYSNAVIEQAKKAGQSVAEIQKLTKEMQKATEDYQNPVYRAAMTFCEPLPVGIIVTLISSLIVRTKKK